MSKVLYADHIDGMNYVKVCWACEGAGAYDQTYTIGCGQGYITMKGTCSHCDGTGILGPDGKPPSASVLNQIMVRMQRKGQAS